MKVNQKLSYFPKKLMPIIGCTVIIKRKEDNFICETILDELIANTTFRIDKNLYKKVLKQANEH